MKIPVSAAKRICRAYNLDQVIIIGLDRKNLQRFHATYGKDSWLCEDAANASRVLDMLLSSTTQEEFILKSKLLWRQKDNLPSHGEHAIFKEVKVEIIDHDKE